jgi:hypothetical protein
LRAGGRVGWGFGFRRGGEERRGKLIRNRMKMEGGKTS